MEERTHFSFLRSYFEAACVLSNKDEQADFLLALCDYALNGNESEAKGVVGGMFRLVKPNIDAGLARQKAAKAGGYARAGTKNKPKNADDVQKNADKCQNLPKSANDMPKCADVLPKNADDVLEKGERRKEKGIRNKDTLGQWEIDFENWWKEYPRKVAKANAKKSFDKVRKNVSVDVLIEAVRKQKQSAQWQRDDGQYIPHPATWLNQGRWEDEVNEGSTGAVRSNQANASEWNLQSDL